MIYRNGRTCRIIIDLWAIVIMIDTVKVLRTIFI